MAGLSQLRLVLYRIRAKLIEHPVFTRGRGVPIDDSAHSKELEELDDLSSQLRLVLRELHNRSNLLNARRQGLWNIDPQDRFRARDSIRSQADQLDDVLALAHDVQELLEDLLRKSGLVSEGEIAKGIGELIEKLYHEAHEHGEVNGAPDGLSYTSPSPNHFAGSVEGVGLLIFVALRAFIYASKQKKSRKAQPKAPELPVGMRPPQGPRPPR
jgi:hypothetical protein